MDFARNILWVRDVLATAPMLKETFHKLEGWTHCEQSAPNTEEVLGRLRNSMGQWFMVVECNPTAAKTLLLGIRKCQGVYWDTPVIFIVREASHELSAAATSAGWAQVAVVGDGPWNMVAIAAMMRMYRGWENIYSRF